MRFSVLIAFCVCAPTFGETVTELAAKAERLKKQGHAAAALTAYQQAAALQPRSASFQDEVGFLLAVLHKSSEAIAHFERAIELDPNQVFNLVTPEPKWSLLFIAACRWPNSPIDPDANLSMR